MKRLLSLLTKQRPECVQVTRHPRHRKLWRKVYEMSVGSRESRSGLGSHDPTRHSVYPPKPSLHLLSLLGVFKACLCVLADAFTQLFLVSSSPHRAAHLLRFYQARFVQMLYDLLFFLLRCARLGSLPAASPEALESEETRSLSAIYTSALYQHRYRSCSGLRKRFINNETRGGRLSKGAWGLSGSWGEKKVLFRGTS